MAPAIGGFCSIGDVNGDGYDDLLVYDYPYKLNIYFGGENPSNQPGLQLDPVAGLTQTFYFTVNALGDINGDGYDDFSYSCRPSSSTNPYGYGGIRIVLGGTFQEITVAIPVANSDLSQLNGIGDINNDGYDDFVHTLFQQPGGGVILQQGFLHYGSEELDLSNPYPLTELMNYGGTVREGFGDINGDGYDDFMGQMDGFIKVWYGGESLSSTYDIILEPYYVGKFLGNGSLAHGDLNGDGYSDVIGADPNIGGGNGRACIWMGGPVMNGTADLFFYGSIHQQLGYDIACADFNGDGYDDIAFSEPCFLDDPASWPGEVRVFAGNPDLHDTTVSVADELIPSSAAGWHFRMIPNPSHRGRGTKLKFYGEGYAKLGNLSLRI
ncbi:MAG: VCBS repeat-containing protein, partial [Candidatus Cloacimonadaceae bacterium]|nr:VCBS repeat-containing protein [Candidatus Cloacimonadaceae bacterium]